MEAISFERPRVRAEGPGGPDVKQGAKIACLDCRSAKIRCSAPTDGRVPCKRCARHGRDCVFEKHRRGRKPGRTNNSKHDYDMDDEADDVPMHGHSHHDGSAYGYGMASSAMAQMQLPDHHPRSMDDHRAGQPVAYPSHHLQSHHGQHYGQPTDASSYAPLAQSMSAAGVSNWRAPMPSDDPRLVSPRNGGMRAMAQSSNAAIQPLAGQSRQPSHVPQFSRQPPSPSQSRDVRLHQTIAHPTFAASQGTMAASNAHNGLSHRYNEHGVDLHLASGPLTSSTAALPASRSHSSGGESSAGTSHHASTTISPPSAFLPPSSLGSVNTPSRSWLDFPTPGTRSLLSPSHLMSTSISTFPSSIGSLPSAWPGSAITSPHAKRRGPTDYFAGAVPPSMDGKATDKPTAESGHYRSASSERSDPSKKRRLDEQEHTASQSGSHGSPSHSSASRAYTRAEEDEECRDRLDDDEVSGAHDIDVLSTPLRLLAHASDAALALRQAKGEADKEVSRSTSEGAATMGLVTPPVPALPAPRRWFEGGRLPNVGNGAAQTVVGSRGALLPKLSSAAQRRDQDRGSYGRANDQFASPLVRSARADASLLPSNLSAIGRSRSYTAVEAAKVAQATYKRSPEQAYAEASGVPLATPVTQSERRAEVLGIHTDVDGRQIEIAPGAVGTLGGAIVEKSVTASTLDPDAWEYRDGRVRSRRTSSLHPSKTNTDSATADSVEDERTGVESAASNSERKTDVSASELDGTITDITKPDDDPRTDKTRLAFRNRIGSLDVHQRRWEVVRRRPSRAAVDATTMERGVSGDGGAPLAVTDLDEDAVSDDSSEESEKLGASHQDFFSMGIFHSKMDNDIDLDPVEIGLLQLRELEKLFDIFFARINPLLTIFDPFLHSVTYVRNRSALLTTVIGALAARLSDEGRHAKLAVTLENHWRQKLLPEALLGGYKSVELAQAFLVLAIYHKPTNKMSEDRSWQYLGFAIRIATEIGVNRPTRPNDEVKDNEQVRRRMRNRSRLWISLWLTDRSLSLQTGRPATIAEEDLVANSVLWHREDFALPEDARLVSLAKLTRLVTTYVRTFDEILVQYNATLQDRLLSTSATVILQSQESIKSLNFARLQAVSDLERWKDIWCVEALDESTDGIQSLAIGTFLVKWRPRAVIDLHYARLHLNSIVLEAMERQQGFVHAAILARSSDATQNAAVEGGASTDKAKDGDAVPSKAADSLRIQYTVLGDVSAADLSAGPNALAVNVIYGALAALRLSNAGQHAQSEWADREAILKRCKALADALIKAGRTPGHRNGAAAPFGFYLKGIITLWETENVGLAADEDDTNTTVKAPQVDQSEAQEASSLPAAGPAKVKSVNDEAPLPTDQIITAVAKTPAAPTVDVQRAVEAITAIPTALNLPKAVQAMTNMPAVATPGGMMQMQAYSVGDEIWGAANMTASVSRQMQLQHQQHHRAASGNVLGTPDAESMDRMWDYLTTYPDAASTFPMSLWQPPTNGALFTPTFSGLTANLTASGLPTPSALNASAVHLANVMPDHIPMPIVAGPIPTATGGMVNDATMMAVADPATAAALNVNLAMATVARPSAV